MGSSQKMEPAPGCPTLASLLSHFVALATTPTQLHLQSSYMHLFVHTVTDSNFSKGVLFVPCRITDADKIASCKIVV